LSGVTAASTKPRRRQIEQLHSIASVGSASRLYAILPQWQLPRIGTMFSLTPDPSLNLNQHSAGGQSSILALGAGGAGGLHERALRGQTTRLEIRSGAAWCGSFPRGLKHRLEDDPWLSRPTLAGDFFGEPAKPASPCPGVAGARRAGQDACGCGRPPPRYSRARSPGRRRRALPPRARVP
jgi:hypothetical protein